MKTRIRNFIKSPRVFAPILAYLILLGPTLYLYSGSPPETEVQVYKGAWLTTVMPSSFAEIKAMGINTVFLRVDPSEGTVVLIQAAHRNGLKVALTTDFKQPYPGRVESAAEFWTFKVIELAKLAEKYGVEFFAPLNEPEEMFEENTERWSQEILPKIKEVYHGEIIWKGKDLMDMDFSGYDYIGFTTGMSGDMTPEEYSQIVGEKLDQALGFAGRDNCKGVMFTEILSWGWESPSVGDETRAFEIAFGGGKDGEDVVRAYEIVFERGKNKAVGFFYYDAFPSVSRKWKEIISRWYREIL